MVFGNGIRRSMGFVAVVLGMSVAWAQSGPQDALTCDYPHDFPKEAVNPAVAVSAQQYVPAKQVWAAGWQKYRCQCEGAQCNWKHVGVEADLIRRPPGTTDTSDYSKLSNSYGSADIVGRHFKTDVDAAPTWDFKDGTRFVANKQIGLGALDSADKDKNVASLRIQRSLRRDEYERNIFSFDSNGEERSENRDHAPATDDEKEKIRESDYDYVQRLETNGGQPTEKGCPALANYKIDEEGNSTRSVKKCDSGSVGSEITCNYTARYVFYVDKERRSLSQFCRPKDRNENVDAIGSVGAGQGSARLTR